MNSILVLKGQLKKQKAPGGFGKPKLSKGKRVSAEHVLKLKEELVKINSYWNKDKTIRGALVSVHYRQVIAKTNRLQILLSENSKHPNESVRGSKFSYENGIQRHVFTYFLSLKSLEKSIDILDRCQKTIETFYSGIICSDDIELINNGKYDGNIMSKSAFVKTVIDCYYVDYFNIDTGVPNIADGKSIVTVYKTGVDTRELLKQLGVNLLNIKMIDEATLQLDKADADILYDKVPYLVAMSVRDFNEIGYDLSEGYNYKSQITIVKPSNEPVVGVIDTHFDSGVYFNEWVEYHNCLDSNITLEPQDYLHGTAVSSIIVDGPSFNPRLQDNCGHFRVRHFGVATASSFSSLSIIRSIRKIVKENQDIKVWNISLGSPMEISENFISVEAAELDKIQNEFDVIFVVAGTNREEKYKSVKIGSPADSLNSLVVNAVDFKGNPASYTRKGPVLSFFYKPDVSYYGGDISDGITVCEPLGARKVMGTSFAAPWITRKMAYLIYIMGLSREVAKALIIDAAAGWDRKDDIRYEKGYGIVPVRIEDILYSRDDEIKFIITGSMEENQIYTYSLPVPQNKNGFPFFAKATLAYFPKGDRNQGVDYTSTEMDLHFGRVMEQNGKPVIKAIDYNRQAEEGLNTIYEEDARSLYRKWDNVKHISEELKENGKPRKVYETGMWGLSIKTKERLEPKNGRGLPFGVVVTLREMNGVNRIDEFIKLCMMKSWFVNTLDVKVRNDIYVKAEEEIDFN